MRRAMTVAIALAAGVLIPAVAPQAQTKLTDVAIQGHVYEPQPLSPTDARIASLRIPAGFTIQRVAEGLNNPRMLAVADDGAIYITQRKPGNVVMLKDLDGDGVVDVQKIVARIKDVHGVAIRGREIYLVDIRRLHVATLQDDGTLDRLRTVVKNLPDAGQHPNRTLAFSPEGDLFLSIGSTCNECIERNPEHATLVKLKLDGGDWEFSSAHDGKSQDDDQDYKKENPEHSGPRGASRKIYASGLRNSIGFDWHPGSGRLYAFDNGIDWLGDDDQSEEVNEVVAGHRYGWPYVYDDDQINPHTEPERTSSEQWARLSDEPVGMYTPHSAPMQMRFYSDAQFPIEYRNDAFVPMRGSWNRKPPSGYEVLRLHFDAGGGFSSFEPFVAGFLQEIPGGAFGFFGRPVGVAVAGDGALLFSDDTHNILYRVAYGSPAAAPAPQQLAMQLFEAPAALQVTSPAIPPNGPIPQRYSDYGKGISPPLKWSGVPANAVSLVLMMEDPNAIAPLPFVHWTLINVDPRSSGLPENVPKVFRPLKKDPAAQGANSISERGYYGPRPPPGDPAHPYHFQLFALDTQLTLPDGFNRQALLKAMQGHVVARGELIGMFQKQD